MNYSEILRTAKKEWQAIEHSSKPVIFIGAATCGRSAGALEVLDTFEKELKKEKIMPLSVEGRKLAEWILMDYGSFIIHVFSEKAREYYSLEKLWGDAHKFSY